MRWVGCRQWAWVLRQCDNVYRWQRDYHLQWVNGDFCRRIVICMFEWRLIFIDWISKSNHWSLISKDWTPSFNLWERMSNNWVWSWNGWMPGKVHSSSCIVHDAWCWCIMHDAAWCCMRQHTSYVLHNQRAPCYRNHWKSCRQCVYVIFETSSISTTSCGLRAVKNYRNADCAIM